ncbi:MAG TPA: signal recognition particle-docking protein FtsY [Bacilli bacterium]|nr:MAG: Signal recognition particle receptor FtsY [Tenericutes bacterium ADurb.BinA124]HNZ50524.1 signal recognition particle-docking protein FtsY [Bacilli bacterium]HPX83967.1 signal recognition particle-docking protein FtsY [Bacilli bacterium]HQC74313.1 signal recognition particle-docking protein FtsY [Bacilli bacterium]
MGFFDLFKSKQKRQEAEKYRIGMEKTRKHSLSKLKRLFTSYNDVTEELFDELEEIFVMADIGVETVIKFIDQLKEDVRTKKITSAKDLQPIIVDKMFDIYLKGEIVNSNLRFNPQGVSVFLFVGVNGVGKTTTIAKIAHKLMNEGKRVLIAAGDTFRAGAFEQLQIWGERVSCPVVSKPEGSDPSSVIYDAIVQAKAEHYDVVLCDTAGRLQTKVNLMKELEKIKRVIAREIPDAPQDTLLVIDATTGQNGLNQAKAFIEATQVSGIVLTKLDGTAKGGIVLAIREKYSIPIKFVCLGEKLEDIDYFDLEKYVYGLFAEMIDEE